MTLDQSSPDKPVAMPQNEHDDQRLESTVAIGQAAYFLVTGIWPLVHIRSFEWITGSKTDRWLVKTVGAQVGVVGGVLGLAVRRRRITPEIEALAVGCALGLAAIDVVYVARRRIRAVYLLDALAEAAFVAGWIAARSGRSRPAD